MNIIALKQKKKYYHKTKLHDYSMSNNKIDFESSLSISHHICANQLFFPINVKSVS